MVQTITKNIITYQMTLKKRLKMYTEACLIMVSVTTVE
jgi:hypothetical protein